MEQPQEVNKHLNIWPPGTIRIGDLYKAKGEDIILQPQPTDDPTILSIGCGTLVFGAFLLIPFALKYGRRPVYIFSTLVQFAMSV
jgi:hypothetical protein